MEIGFFSANRKKKKKTVKKKKKGIKFASADDRRIFSGLKFPVWNVPGGCPSLSSIGDLVAIAGDQIELRHLHNGRVLKNLDFFHPNTLQKAVLFLANEQGNDVIVASSSATPPHESIAERRRWAGGRDVAVWRRGTAMWWRVMVALPGARIAAAEDRRVIVVDSGTGADLLAFEGHRTDVSALEPVGDGTVLSADSIGWIRWWSAEDGSQLQERDHGWEVTALALSPCKGKVVVGLNDRDVGVYTFPEWTLLSMTRCHGGDSAVLSVAFSPDGRFFATGGNDSRVNLLCAETGDVLVPYILHKDIVNNVFFSPGSTKLLSSSRDQTVRVFKFFSRWERKVRALFGSVDAGDVHRDALSGVAKRLKRHYELDSMILARC